MNYDKIKIFANKNKISVKELTERIGMTEQGYYLAIKNNTLKIRDLEKICNVLKISIVNFFEDSTNEQIKEIKYLSEISELKNKIISLQDIILTKI